MAYAWKITRDSIADPDAPEGTNLNARGVVGPGHAPSDLVEKLKRTTPGVVHFRMLDDDRIPYYYGLYLADDEDMSACGMEPLFEFGMPNAGCTIIEVRNPETGKYEPI
jgi:hypothetical protein